MSVTLESGIVHLRGDCRVEEAETLLSLLQAEPGDAVVDLTAASHLHTAVVQILLALRPKLTGSPSDPFITTWLMPLLVANRVH